MVTTVTPVENGPLALRGDLVVRHEDGTLERLPRAALCRCGSSRNKPFCNNGHLEIGFHAPGAVPSEAVARNEERPMTTDRQPPAPITPDVSQVSVVDNPRASRFELRVGGQLAGYATYRDVHRGRAFEHTVIESEYEGQGLASRLIRYALDDARSAGSKVLPFCPFVRAFIADHPEYLDLVDQPQRFGLTPAAGSGG